VGQRKLTREKLAQRLIIGRFFVLTFEGIYDILTEV
jgi:hypothetical protein